MLHRDGCSPLQFVTHVFLHAGVAHLVGNMVFLLVFGNAVNAKLGHGLFLLAYFALGIVAGVAWLSFGDGAAALGASGAIMGLVGLFLVYFPRNDVNVFYLIFIGPAARGGAFTISSYWLILLYVALDLLGFLGPGSGVAHVAHLGGTAAGVAAGLLLLASGLVTSTEWEENLLMLLRVFRSR